MRTLLLCIGIALIVALAPLTTSAAGELLYRSQHHLFTIQSGRYPEWRQAKEVWTFQGRPLRLPAEYRVDGDRAPALPAGFERHEEVQWNRDAIHAVLAQSIASVLDRPAGSVTIRRSSTGAVLFDGVGLTGRSVDLDRAVTLTIEALTRGVSDITLPVREVQPHIVADPALQEEGIREVVTIGESDFSGSPWARRHNIRVGLARFNGTLIPKGETFSFNAILGPVNAATGYLKELVIKGDRTEPDYGGGLCQVGTTMYRGVWEYGFPILQRKNHSYSVHYYSPQGTDATIYPPNVDIRFLNDSLGAMLIQTYIDADDHAYFIYYGTRDDRQAEVIGPYTWGSVAPPPDRVEYTTEIPAGTTRKLGERVPGIKALWYRIIARASGEVQEEAVYSTYEARPRFHQIGVDASSPLLGSGSTKVEG
ncbi:MAG: VanW family protein [Candidatus Peribacteraceae bacterium]|nr:VanW family protein [Candidatus Peribacteraceae bacterium]